MALQCRFAWWSRQGRRCDERRFCRDFETVLMKYSLAFTCRINFFRPSICESSYFDQEVIKTVVCKVVNHVRSLIFKLGMSRIIPKLTTGGSRTGLLKQNTCTWFNKLHNTKASWLGNWFVNWHRALNPKFDSGIQTQRICQFMTNGWAELFFFFKFYNDIVRCHHNACEIWFKMTWQEGIFWTQKRPEYFPNVGFNE